MKKIPVGGVFATSENAVPNIDVRYGPYPDLNTAYTTLLNMGANIKGMTVGIEQDGIIDEYWLKSGTTLQDFEKKNTTEQSITIDTTNNILKYMDKFYVLTPYTLTAPTMNPQSRVYYNGNPISVSINAKEGSNIYYTTDGTNPTTQSTKYISSIQVSNTTTIKAVCEVNGILSPIGQATYTFTNVTPTVPSASPSAGLKYGNTVTVSLSIPEVQKTYGAIVQYKVDNGSYYTGESISFVGDGDFVTAPTIHSVVTKNTIGNKSTESSPMSYQIAKIPTPSITASGHDYDNSRQVTITYNAAYPGPNGTTKTTGLYTTDGSAPTSTNSVQKTEFVTAAPSTLKPTLTSTKTIKARSLCEGGYSDLAELKVSVGVKYMYYGSLDLSTITPLKNKEITSDQIKTGTRKQKSNSTYTSNRKCLFVALPVGTSISSFKYQSLVTQTFDWNDISDQQSTQWYQIPVTMTEGDYIAYCYYNDGISSSTPVEVTITA